MARTYYLDQDIEITLARIDEIQNKSINDALASGCEIVEGTGNSVLLDIDEPKKHVQFADCWAQFSKHCPIREVTGWRSKSGNVHVQVILDDELTPYEIVLWQLLLGSDPERERWNAARIILNQAPFQRLFKPAGTTLAPILLFCRHCSTLSPLTKKQYRAQLCDVDRTWRCLSCGEERCRVIE